MVEPCIFTKPNFLYLRPFMSPYQLCSNNGNVAYISHPLLILPAPHLPPYGATELPVGYSTHNLYWYYYHLLYLPRLRIRFAYDLV